MTTPHKTKIFGSVNLALMEPLETLSAERLKLLSKEEIRAYLHYYGMQMKITW